MVGRQVEPGFLLLEWELTDKQGEEATIINNGFHFGDISITHV